MDINEELLYHFEKGLNPQNLGDSPIPATVLGFGEISTIFQIADYTNLAFKRMPLFSDRVSAETYILKYIKYCRLLIEAGLKLPEHGTCIIQVPDRPVSVYIVQRQFPIARFSHKLIHTLDRRDTHPLLERIVSETEKIWHFNNSRRPSIELALDGQISNWVWLERETGPPNDLCRHQHTASPDRGPRATGSGIVPAKRTIIFALDHPMAVSLGCDEQVLQSAIGLY